MNIKSMLRAVITAAAFAVASVANAGAITEVASWSKGGDGDITVVTSLANGVELFYARGPYYCAGCGDNYFDFSTTVDATGAGGFDFRYNAFNGWYMASSDLTFLINYVPVRNFVGYDFQDTVSFAFQAGDILTLRAHETNYDSQPYIDGRITLSNFSGVFAPAASDVPEPGSLALMGLGLLGAAAARRKAGQRK